MTSRAVKKMLDELGYDEKALGKMITTYREKTRFSAIAMLWICFFLSGACGLVYQVAWTRMLTLIFGASVFAVSTVLMTFMGGLALGSYLFGRIADRIKYPVRLYGILEIAIGVYAFFLPLILKQYDFLYVTFFRAADPSFFTLLLFRFTLTAALLILPTTLMGATLPILSAFVTRNLKSVGWSTGSLYALNTFGAVLGCAAAGFYLIGRFGILQTIHIAVAANVIIGAFMYLAFSRWQTLEAEDADTSQAAHVGDVRTSETPAVYPQPIVRLVLLFLGLSGFCSLGYEVLWTRALVYHLNISVYAFATMLTTILVGIALGSFIFARIVDRTREPLLLFSAIELLIGISAVMSLPILGKFFNELERAFPGLGTIVWLPSSNKFIKSFLIMFVPTLLMGATFPVAAKICVPSVRKVGKSIGVVYSANTVGAIIGSFAAGFILVPLLGIGKSILALGCVNVAIGAAIFCINPQVSFNAKRRLSLAAVPALAVFGLFVWRFTGVQFASPLENAGRVLYYREGIGATVKVFEDNRTGIRQISIDGYPVAATGNQLDWRGPEGQSAQAHFPMLLHQDPKDICIIGFGAGGTSYGVSLYDVDTITCVELSREVPKAAPLLAEVNHDVLNHPKFKLVIDDGRNFILRTEKKFDIITVDATSPKCAGNVSLYTKEFYDMCKEKLAPGGIMAQWMPYHLLSRREDLMLFKTFQQSFPHFSVWFTSDLGYFQLIGSKDPLRIDFQRLEKRMSQRELRGELAAIHLNSPAKLLACFAMGEDIPLSLFDGIPVNTDNHPYIEYFRDDGGLGEFIFESRVGQPPVYNFGDSPDEAARNRAEYSKALEVTNHLISAHYWWKKGYLGEALTRTRLALLVEPTNREAYVLHRVLEKKYKRLYLAKAAAAQGKNDIHGAVMACNRILRIMPDDRDTLALLVTLHQSVGHSRSAL